MAAEKERDPGLSSAEIEKYLDILAKDPNSRVFAPLAEAYRKAGFFDDAVETALEGLKVHPNYLGGRVALGRAYFEKRQYVDAAAEMQKVVKSAPDNIIAHKVLGQIASRQNDLPAAEKAFRMVLLLDPRDEEAQQFLADLAGKPTPAPVQVPVPPAPPVEPPPVELPPVEPQLAEPPQVRPSPPLSQPVPPPPPAALPFDEIQGIEDIDLQAEDIFGVQPPAPAEDGMELESFARDSPPGEPERTVEPPPAPSPAPLQTSAPRPDLPPDHEDSPFEVFTRDRGPRPAPAPEKSERVVETAPRELEIETTSYNPPDEFTVDGFDLPLSGLDEELPQQGPTHGMDLDSWGDTASSVAAPVTEPETAPELELELERGPEPGPEQEPEPEFAAGLETELELEREPGPGPEQEPELVAGLETGLELEPGPEREPEPEQEEAPGAELELDLEADLEVEGFSAPSIGPAPEQPLVAPVEVYEDLSPEDEEPAAAEIGRGVFDTETLASIYTSQGFYGRAAEIYRRLIVQNPGDPGLRGKLDELLALERRESGTDEPPAPAEGSPFVSPAPPPPAPSPQEQIRMAAPALPTASARTIHRLNTLLEAFKEGRSR